MKASKFNARIALGWAISLTFLGYVVSKLEWSAFWTAIKGISVLDLVLLVAVYLAGFFLRGLRSKLLLPALNFPQSFGGVLIGYAANNVLPARLGEVVRAQIIGQNSGIKRSTTFATIVVERILDGFAIVILLLVGSAALQLPDWAHKARMTGVILFSGALAGTLLTSATQKYWIHLVPKSKIGDMISGLVEGVRITTRSIGTIAGTLAFSLAIWTVEAAMFYAGFAVFNFDLSFRAALFVMGIVNLGVLIPSSPGNVGLFQYFCMLALGALGIMSSEATAYGVILHICQYLPVTVMGLLLLPRFGLRSFHQAAH